MLNIYYARESTDKEKFIFENITPGSFVIVPDQYTLEAERERLKKEREKLYLNARVESRRIVNERTEQAEELLAQIEEIAHAERLTESDLIRARTLKNRLADKAYEAEAEEEEHPVSEKADLSRLKPGDRVFVGAMQSAGEILSVNARKKEAEVLVGSLRLNVKAGDLYAMVGGKKSAPKTDKVSVVRKLPPVQEVKTEINLLGMTVSEAIQEVDAFIDRAVLSGLEEVKIIHGLGTGKLREGIRNHLRSMPNVLSFRQGKYGEGDAGVTIVTLK